MIKNLNVVVKAVGGVGLQELESWRIQVSINLLKVNGDFVYAVSGVGSGNEEALARLLLGIECDESLSPFAGEVIIACLDQMVQTAQTLERALKIVETAVNSAMSEKYERVKMPSDCSLEWETKIE